MQSSHPVNLILAALFAAAQFASAPTLAQGADRQSDCPGLEAACDADDSASGTDPNGLAADPSCQNTNLDSVRTEYHRAVGGFVEASVEERVFDAMLWLRRALNMEIRWDVWYYTCAEYSGRPLIEFTLDENLRQQYRRFHPAPPPPPAADIMGSAG